MKKELYTEIKTTLMTVVGIHSVKIWNNEIMKGLDTIGRFPLVFLEFAGLDYQTASGKTQECNAAKITVHILYKTIDGEDTGVFDMSQAVFTAMQGVGYDRTNERPIYSGGEVIDWQINFDCPRFEDDGAVVDYTAYRKPPIELTV